MKLKVAFFILCVFSFTAEATQQTQNETVAQAYFNAYIARDWQTLALYLHNEGSFADTTAKPVFGEVAVAGKEQTIAYFTNNYASILAMSFTPSRQWVSGDVAVFEGELNWQIKLAENKVVKTVAMPFITILELKDGQVLRHRDYADYQPFLKAYAQVNQAN